MTSILPAFVIIFVAIFVMIQSGKIVVRSLSVVARYLHLSEYVISFALIAFATSLPELSVGINSAILGIPELSFGDIIGTNIVNFSLILGVVTIVGGSINLKDYTHFKSNRLFQLAAVLAPLLLMLDGTLSRIDGVILICIFIWILIRLFDIDDRILGRKVLRPHMANYVYDNATTGKQTLKHVLFLLASISVLLVSTLYLINSVENISHTLRVSEALVGILIISVCTSLPDFVVGLRSVRRHKGGVALGDVLGAATINSTLTLGIVALISPIILENRALVWTGIVFTLLSLLLIFYFLKGKHTLSRKEGIILLSAYILFVLTQIGTLFF